MEARGLISEPPSPRKFWRFVYDHSNKQFFTERNHLTERNYLYDYLDHFSNTMSTGFALHTDPITLADLAEQKIWVAWKEQLNKQGKPTKVPKDPATGDNAKVPSDPNTYGTLDDAITCSKAMRGKGGVGVVLGSIGNEHHLVGIISTPVVIPTRRQWPSGQRR